MIHIILYQPEIPPNTGNIIRLCANTGAQLHLIEPLGFDMDDKRMRRAGLDYHEYARVTTYPDLESCLKTLNPSHLYACSTKGHRCHSDVTYGENDALLFGPETTGLPEVVLNRLDEEHILRLPMLPESRSLNLSNAVSVFVYEAWRQLGFAGS